MVSLGSVRGNFLVFVRKCCGCLGRDQVDPEWATVLRARGPMMRQLRVRVLAITIALLSAFVGQLAIAEIPLDTILDLVFLPI